MAETIPANEPSHATRTEVHEATPQINSFPSIMSVHITNQNQTLDIVVPKQDYQWSPKLISAANHDKSWNRLLQRLSMCTCSSALDTSTAPPARAKPRAILTRVEAIEIYLCKLARDASRTSTPSAAAVSRAFSVSEKTVRGIWRGRTWVNETSPLVPANAPRGPRPAASRHRPRRTGGSAVSFSTLPSASGNGDFIRGAESCHVQGEGVASVAAAVVAPSNPGTDADCCWIFDLTAAVGSAASNGCGCESADPFHDDWPHWTPAAPPVLVEPPPPPADDWY
jgi:hypothetical protein